MEKKIVMVDAAIHAIQELMWKHPEALLYGQDVGERIGGVFRETVTLGKNSVAREYSIQPSRKLISLDLQQE